MPPHFGRKRPGHYHQVLYICTNRDTSANQVLKIPSHVNLVVFTMVLVQEHLQNAHHALVDLTALQEDSAIQADSVILDITVPKELLHRYGTYVFMTCYLK